MAGLEIFKNADDNILFTGGGNVLKRPYDFGSAWMHPGNIIISVPIDVVTEFSGLGFSYFYDVSGSRAVYGLFKAPYKQTEQLFGLSRFGSSTLVMYHTELHGQNLGGNFVTPDVGQIFHAITYSYSTSEYKTQINNIKRSGTRTLLSTDSTEIRFAKAWTYSSSKDSLNVKQGEFHFFNRAITQDEITYYYGNGLGNKLLSLEGLYCTLKFEFAEILDFSITQDGTDLRVGIRDYSGNNRHGEISGLPAGTPQEQVDFANATYFLKY